MELDFATVLITVLALGAFIVPIAYYEIKKKRSQKNK